MAKMTVQEKVDKVKTICNTLNSKNMVALMVELYYGLSNYEKDEFLRETENAMEE